ncbi:hypothetical protein [Pseudorhodobacter sp.]|uniref:hypothetical protein n=1 Tax=Pseudorhodobacter sp. TaxID=1934400 RepID=UPI002647A2FA|nr:hypothetical protein [Pseudorhodobacter sp.]MDN5787837.1 hypothetical protein [Pseudorhodobacter sp.]
MVDSLPQARKPQPDTEKKAAGISAAFFLVLHAQCHQAKAGLTKIYRSADLPGHSASWSKKVYTSILVDSQSNLYHFKTSNP